MNNLDFLIPNEIVELCQFDCFEFSLTLKSSPSRGLWPTVKVTLGDEVIYDDKIVDKKNIHHKKYIDNTQELLLRIEYYGKTSKDTIVKDNEIVEDQGIIIDDLIVNDVSLIKSNIIYALGNYKLNLDENQKKYFVEHGLDLGPTHSLNMFINGIWELKFKTPVVPYLIGIRTTKIKYENWPNVKLLNEIYSAIVKLQNKD